MDDARPAEQRLDAMLDEAFPKALAKADQIFAEGFHDYAPILEKFRQGKEDMP